jgi:DNA-directed RNA polymerase subunit L
MSTTVKNIKKTAYPIPLDTIELCTKLGVLKYLPKTVPSGISFELHNTTPELVNALRRCINSELEVLIMDFDANDLSSDDNFIITHELRKRINYIPIRQIFAMTFNVNVYNNTDEIIPVYSHSIKVSKSEKKKAPVEKKEEQKNMEALFSETFILTYLRPGKRLVIENIHVVSGQAYKKHAAFSFEGRVGFKCLDIPDKPVVEKKDGSVLKPSSMNIEPENYKLTIPRQKYIDTVHIVKMGLKSLDTKLNKIYKIVKDANENFYSSEMEINYLKNKAVFKIYEETNTIGHLLSKYGYKVDTTIENIHCIKLHPSFNYIIVEIYHADPHKIMLLAIEMIKKELINIGGSF